jgi:hypothetical protein
LHPPIHKLLHTADIPHIDYYEAFQRKYRANRLNSCHPRIECPDSKSGIKICWDFVRAIFNTPVWLQGGYYLAIAAQIPAEQKTGCLPLHPAPSNSKPSAWRASAARFFFWVRRLGQRPSNYYDIATPLAYAPRSTSRGYAEVPGGRALRGPRAGWLSAAPPPRYGPLGGHPRQPHHQRPPLSQMPPGAAENN